MSPLFQRKKEEETHKCNCEICRFSSVIEERLGPEWHETLSPFIWLPSTVRKINPEESLKEARKYETSGDLTAAVRHYTEAFIGAIATEGTDVMKYGKVCIGFHERHPSLSTAYPSVKAYNMLLCAED